MTNLLGPPNVVGDAGDGRVTWVYFWEEREQFHDGGGRVSGATIWLSDGVLQRAEPVRSFGPFTAKRSGDMGEIEVSLDRADVRLRILSEGEADTDPPSFRSKDAIRLEGIRRMTIIEKESLVSDGKAWAELTIQLDELGQKIMNRVWKKAEGKRLAIFLSNSPLAVARVAGPSPGPSVSLLIPKEPLMKSLKEIGVK